MAIKVDTSCNMTAVARIGTPGQQVFEASVPCNIPAQSLMYGIICLLRNLVRPHDSRSALFVIRRSEELDTRHHLTSPRRGSMNDRIRSSIQEFCSKRNKDIATIVREST
ncbi:hypothetical protein VOLCADRAFT_94080 [Volvox carteri f. nagariensis]|uniref:Uncharacterized protein n=1 Tax=Volvox carteri f. nagariensis TaxID=3068 RepID=D8U3V3_VOLCA|nr:uncharacterized protein VOLCADRAFT_94080 [Volvox carteri f. nagariensis]EFJ45594.1 hypothetical protein VOLCADRAFT_94080 [Volvox carteri f. nagariensis]|eukprot:XP_002953284.1 hypothetical protein VOLCADRAFT_94080 [Volvox carteri f. nagariensis]